QLLVLAGTADVVEHRHQPGEDVGHGLLAHRRPVPLDALAVVGVLGGHALQVGRALGELLLGGLKVSRARRLVRPVGTGPVGARPVSTGPVSAGPAGPRPGTRPGRGGRSHAGRTARPGGRVLATGLAGPAGARLRRASLAGVPDLPRRRVDAPQVADHRPPIGFLRRAHQAAPPSAGFSSSTISASTTSSSAGSSLALPPSDAPPAEALACDWA